MKTLQVSDFKELFKEEVEISLLVGGDFLFLFSNPFVNPLKVT